MKIKIIYGKDVNGYRVIPTMLNSYGLQMGPNSHIISFSNNFQSGWKKLGTWYMGCCHIRGLHILTREQCQELFMNIPWGEYIYGTSVEDMMRNIKIRMRALCNYLSSKSPIPVNIYWESRLESKKFRIFIGEMRKFENSLLMRNKSTISIPITLCENSTLE